MRFIFLALAAMTYAGTTEGPGTTTTTTSTTTTTPAPTPPASVCTKFPYEAILPLSSNTAALSWCSKNFPVACTGRQVQKKVKVAERTADPEPAPTTLVKKAQPKPAALLSTLEALGKNFASTACACIETPTPC